MNRNEPDDPYPLPEDTVEATAAAWLARKDRGFTPEESAAFAAWCAASECHRLAVAELEEAWDSLDGLASALPDAAAAEPDPDVLRGSSVAPARVGRRPFFWMAAAAVFAVGLGLWAWTRVASDEAPALAFETPVGGGKQVRLEDGSELQLNTQTSVEVQYRARERRVKLLRGEVFVSVAKNPQRPFFVLSRDARIRAVGTAFAVAHGEEGTSVLVTEGKVAVLRQPAPADSSGTLVEAGELAQVPCTAGPESVRVLRLADADVRRRLAWQRHRLEFRDAPLFEVVREFNRYNRRQLRVADAETGALRIGGSFKPDNLEGLLRLLEESFGVISDRPDPDTIVLRRRP